MEDSTKIIIWSIVCVTAIIIVVLFVYAWLNFPVVDVHITMDDKAVNAITEAVKEAVS